MLLPALINAIHLQSGINKMQINRPTRECILAASIKILPTGKQK